jgi:hypothetical protein
VVSCGPWRCHGAKEALNFVWLLYSNTLSVRLCQLGTTSIRCIFWRLLGGEGGHLEGLTCPKPPKPVEEFVFLSHASCLTLLEEQLIEPCLQGSTGEPPKPWWLGVTVSSLGLS